MTRDRIGGAFTGTTGRKTIATALLTMATVLTLAAGPAAAAGPFTGFAGSWTGGGSIAMTDGSREAIHCKARYKIGSDGQALGINVLCASDSYRVHILSHVAVQGGSFSGSWQETTRQISGNLTGQIPAPDTYQASLETLGGGLQPGARTNGKQQAITITSQGSDIAGADILLRKM